MTTVLEFLAVFCIPSLLVVLYLTIAETYFGWRDRRRARRRHLRRGGYVSVVSLDERRRAVR